jgi:hypothetical protein
MEKGDQYAARHIMEVKLDNRIFSFIDYKGFLVDFLVKETDGHRIRLQEQRIDIADKGNFSRSVFFSWENFGFQIEAKDFEGFHSFVDQFFGWMQKFGKYNFGTLVRIGTKSTIFYHKKGKSFEGVKDIYKSRLLKDHSEWEKNVGAKINDVAYTVELKQGDGADVRLVIGPMTFDEAMQKGFDRKDEYQALGFKDDHSGIFMDIDVYQTGKFDVNFAQLAEKVHGNINVIEKHMEGFVSYFFKQDGE